MALAGGGHLTVRPVGPGDLDGLVALYATLDAEDRYRRFFSGLAPPRSFFQRLAEVRGRGGFGVVAVDGAGRIVGEANYELLPDGDGELGMAVARDWRGWLGPYLLDTLVDAAAAGACPTSRPTSSSPTGGCCPSCGTAATRRCRRTTGSACA